MFTFNLNYFRPNLKCSTENLCHLEGHQFADAPSSLYYEPGHNNSYFASNQDKTRRKPLSLVVLNSKEKNRKVKKYQIGGRLRSARSDDSLLINNEGKPFNAEKYFSGFPQNNDQRIVNLGK